MLRDFSKHMWIWSGSSNELLQVERVRNDANSELRKTLEDRIGGLESEIIALKSQLSQQQVKLSEAVMDAERQRGDLLQRAEEAEARLAAIQNYPALAVSSDSHVLVPIAALRLAGAQFVSLARAFEKSGNIVSQVMCEARSSGHPAFPVHPWKGVTGLKPARDSPRCSCPAFCPA